MGYSISDAIGGGTGHTNRYSLHGHNSSDKYLEFRRVGPMREMTLYEKDANGNIKRTRYPKLVTPADEADYRWNDKPLPDFDGKLMGPASPPPLDPFDDGNRQGPYPNDPLVFDLDGDNSLSVTNAQGGINFDHDGDGFAQLSAWVAQGDGILCIDRNGNGTIDNGLEIFGENMKLSNGSNATSAMHALSEFDTNRDGVIDANDADFANLRFITSDGTLVTMAEAGIVSINLDAVYNETEDEHGNRNTATATFVRDDNSTGTYGEFWVVQDHYQSVPLEWLDVSDDVIVLPELWASGKVHTLHQTMMRDTSGQLQQLVENFIAEPSDAARWALVEQIMTKWAGVEPQVDGSRGTYFDATQLKVLEQFMGSDFVGDDGSSNPHEFAAQYLQASWARLRHSIYAQLMMQSHISDLFADVDTQFDAQTGEITYDLSAVIAAIDNVMATDADAGKALVVQFAAVIKGLGLEKDSGFFDPLNDDCFYTHFTANDRELKWMIDIIGKTETAMDATNYGDFNYSSGMGDDYYRLVGNWIPEGYYLDALAGNDTVYGDYGGESIIACSGDDILDGGDGYDALSGAKGNDIVFGGDGGDVIFGGEQSDILIGGAGDDTLYGDYEPGEEFDQSECGNDIIIGGTGHDYSIDYYGDETYAFSAGDGNDRIVDMDGNDRIFFKEGITANDITVNFAGNHLVIDYGTGDRIIVENQLPNNTIEQIEFADGTVLTYQDFTQNAGQIVLTKEYDFSQGHISIPSTEMFTRLQFPEGVTLDQVQFMYQPNGLIIYFDGVDASIVLEEYPSVGRAEEFAFSDGTIITDISPYISGICAEQDTVLPDGIKELHLWGEGDINATGNDMDNFIGGNAGDNIFAGGLGDDTLADGNGSDDTYVYNLGDGNDWIDDFGGYDKIWLGQGITLDNLKLTKDGDTLRFTFDGSEGIIWIANYFVNDENKIDEIVFADGTRLTQSEIDAMFDTSGDNVLVGTSDHEYLEGGLGNDTYVYNADGSYDTIYDTDGYDKVLLGEGITPDDVKFFREGDHLNFLFNFEGGILVQDYFLNNENKIEEVVFADGTIITDLSSHLYGLITYEDGVLSDGMHDLYLHGDADATVVGNDLDNFFDLNSGDNTIIGGKGYDYFANADGGNDTYIYNLGDNEDIMHDVGGYDKIQFGQGITLDKVSFVRDGDHLKVVVRDDQNPGAIYVENYFINDDNKIEEVVFADGTRLTPNDIPLRIETEGDDILVGIGADDRFYGGAGNDGLFGGGGSDTYVYNVHDGHDWVVDDSGSLDTVEFGEGITPDHVKFFREGDHLHMALDDFAGSITVADYFLSNNNKIEQIVFADGTIITDIDSLINGIVAYEDAVLPDGLRDLKLHGDADATVAGNDLDNNIASGNSGDNTFIGGLGNDVIWEGAGGNDTFVFNAGDGYDWVEDFSGYDTIQMGQGIERSHVKFLKDGDHLQLVMEDFGSSVTIANYFVNDDNKIEEVVFADGTRITDIDSQIDGMIAYGDAVLEDGMRHLNLYSDADATLIGNNSDNNINGGAGNNTLIGAQGDDVFWDGAGGDDAYVFADGDGNDLIYETFGNDTVRFDESVDKSSVAFFMDGDSLVIDYGANGGQDIITVAGQLYADNAVERFELADGSYITNADVNQIIQNMAAYAANNSIEFTNIDSVKNNAELMAIIANSWSN